MLRGGPPSDSSGVTDDRSIYRRFAGGQDEALRHVQGWVEGVVHLGRWNFADPQGVVQDALVRLLGAVRAGGFEGRSSFKTFVFSVAKFTCIDAYRRERLRRRVESPDEIGEEPADTRADSEEALIASRRREALTYVFQRLPEECRRLWGWVYADGLAAADVAARLGITAAHARVRVHRCLEKARAIGRDFLECDRTAESRP